MSLYDNLLAYYTNVPSHTIHHFLKKPQKSEWTLQLQRERDTLERRTDEQLRYIHSLESDVLRMQMAEASKRASVALCTQLTVPPPPPPPPPPPQPPSSQLTQTEHNQALRAKQGECKRLQDMLSEKEALIEENHILQATLQSTIESLQVGGVLCRNYTLSYHCST